MELEEIPTIIWGEILDVVSKLKFISKIKEGEVVDVRTLSLMPKNSWITITYRTIRTIIDHEESRSTTFTFFEDVYNNAFILIAKYLPYSNITIYNDAIDMILSAIRESKDGINNHSKTYKEDRMHTAKVETLTNMLKTKEEELNRTIASFKKLRDKKLQNKIKR